MECHGYILLKTYAHFICGGREKRGESILLTFLVMVLNI